MRRTRAETSATSRASSTTPPRTQKSSALSRSWKIRPTHSHQSARPRNTAAPNTESAAGICPFGNGTRRRAPPSVKWSSSNPAWPPLAVVVAPLYSAAAPPRSRQTWRAEGVHGAHANGCGESGITALPVDTQRGAVRWSRTTLQQLPRPSHRVPRSSTPSGTRAFRATIPKIPHI